MTDKTRVGIIGAGNIGSELHRKINNLEWNTEFILKDDGVYNNLNEKIDVLGNYKKHCKKIDAVFLAIPTLDDGKTAFGYMSYFLERGTPIVTCEKGGLGNYFPELRRWKDKIGYSAAVGGGTRMLRYLEEKLNPSVKEIHVIINGTLNYIFDEISKGKSLGKAVEDVKGLGYAEPEAVTPLEVINKETTEDIPKKTVILFNICNLSSKCIRARDIKTQKIKKQELERLVKEANNRRYIVSISKEKNENEIIGGFNYKIDEWIVSAGFKRIDNNPLFMQLKTSGVDNSLLICDGEYSSNGNYILKGPGAGAGPTTASMIKDALDLIKK